MIKSTKPILFFIILTLNSADLGRCSMNPAKKLNVDHNWPLKKVALANGQLEFIVRMISYKKTQTIQLFHSGENENKDLSPLRQFGSFKDKAIAS